MKRPRLQVFHGKHDDFWYTRLVAANGKPVLVSEGYALRDSARRLARRIARFCKGVPVENVDG